MSRSWKFINKLGIQTVRILPYSYQHGLSKQIHQAHSHNTSARD